MANFVQNDISLLIFFFFFSQPVYYVLDATKQSIPGKSKEMRERWAGVDKNIGIKMCWKLVDDVSEEIIVDLLFILQLNPVQPTYKLIL